MTKNDHLSQHVNVLMLDDKDHLLSQFEVFFEIAGYTFRGFKTTREFESFLPNASYDLLIMDLAVDHRSKGYDLVKGLVYGPLKVCPDAIVVHSAHSHKKDKEDEFSKDDAISLGMTVILKPINDPGRKAILEKLAARISIREGGESGHSEGEGGIDE